MNLAVWLLFFLSGAAGLIYEVLWARYLALFLGNTALAHTIVLSAYMAGLGSGYAWLGRKADKTPNPLGLYGWLELGVALTGLATLPLLGPLAILYAGHAAPGAAALGPLGGKILASLCVVFIPAFLMGGTFPALCRWARGRPDLREDALPWLYFLNSAGAASGALATGFALIPWLGLDGSLCLAAAINLAIGTAALWLARGRDTAPQTAGAKDRGGPPRQDFSPKERQAFHLAIFFSGMAAMAYEIAWIRLLALVLGSSTYSFSLMLSAFILGIALGALLAGRKAFPKVDCYILLGSAQAAIGVCVLIALPLCEELPYDFRVLSNLFARAPAYFYLYEAMKFLFCLALMLPSTVFLGLSLPLAGRVVLREDQRAGSDVGTLFAINTAGNVLGAALAGLILLPLLGIKLLLETAAALNLVTACLMWWQAKAWGIKPKIALSLATALFLVFTSGWGTSWDSLLLTSGEFHQSDDTLPSFPQYKERSRRRSLLYYKDDAESTVSVESSPDGVLVLRVNGKVEAGTGSDMRTQILLAHIPLHLKPESREVLLVGLGSGISAGSALSHPLERLDVVEISPAVAEASRFFASYNRRALDDSRLTLHINDAKSFLHASARRYDVIISEPSNPWMAGVGGLFTVEFYRQARAAMNPGGLMAQWLHFYEMDAESLSMVLRTFSSVFGHLTLWEIPPSRDLILIGSEKPLGFDPGSYAARFARDEVRQDLERLGMRRPATLLSRQYSCENTVETLMPRGRLNQDRFPLLEYQAPKAFFLGNQADISAYDDLKRLGGTCFYLAHYLRARGKTLAGPEILEINNFKRADRLP